jgi:hypothetical protein
LGHGAWSMEHGALRNLILLLSAYK